jgi:hypothetical protein
VEPLSNDLRVRYRIDGVLQEVPVPVQMRKLQRSVINILKLTAGLDLGEDRRPQDGRISLELGGQPTRLSGVAVNAAESNSAIELFMQVGTTLSLQEEAQLLVLAQVASKHAFHVLRTQKQLGYVVQCSVRSVGTSRGLTVLIQSSVQPPAQLEAEIESWMREFRSGPLAELSTSSFAEYQSAVSALLDEQPKTLQQETSQIWGELVEGTYRFQHEAQLARAVRELELTQVRSPLMTSDCHRGPAFATDDLRLPLMTSGCH